MKIEHVAMWVKDLEKAKNFFTEYFEGSAGELYHNVKTGFKSYFISFDNGSRLELMTRAELFDDPQISGCRTGYIHIAFSVGSRQKVDELTERLRQSGYEVMSVPRVTGDGYYESCVATVEGNLVEITV